MGSELQFYLLDVNTETIQNRTEVRLWGVDRKGRPVLVRHPAVFGYFFVIPKAGLNVESVAQLIVEREIPNVNKVEVVEKKHFGRSLRVVRVESNQPDLISRAAHEIGKMKEVERTAEDDIRPAPRYLIDHNLVPCGWHEAEVRPSETSGVAVDTFEIDSPPVHVESDRMPQLKILAFSLVAVGLRGSARHERDPIAAISVATSEGKTTSFVREEKSDREVLRQFQAFIQEYDPDIITGYTNNRLDWPYIVKRAEKTGFKLLVDRSGSGPHPSMYGHISVAGRANVDMYDVASDMIEIKVKTLENVAEFFGINELAKFEAIDDVDYSRYWEKPDLRKQLVAWNEARATTTLDVTETNLPFATQLAALTGMPLDQVLTAAVGFRVDWYLIRQAQKIGELIPKRIEQPYFPYRGAVVLEPKLGIRDNVAVLDFASMYPSLMILRNLSPDTLIPAKERVPEKDVFEVKETKAKFRKSPEGFFPAVLRKIIEQRKQIRKQVEKLDPKSLEYKILREREKAVKVITNACYGYAGWVGARWYAREVAESAASLGRETIGEVIRRAKKLGLEVIYGDTDSVFLENQPDKIERLLDAVEKDLELDIRVDKVFRRVLFTEAKKRYAGLLPDGRLEIVGLEVVRGDWAEIARSVQETVIRYVLEDNSPSRAVEHVRKIVGDLRARKVQVRDLVIWKSLTKPIAEYQVRAPHVEAAKKLLKKGWDLTIGDKIGYVVMKGPGKLYEKAQPLAFVDPEDVDVEYYERNQVLPACGRILGLLGIKEEDLLPKALS